MSNNDVILCYYVDSTKKNCKNQKSGTGGSNPPVDDLTQNLQITITESAGTITYTILKPMKAANDEDWDINKSTSCIWASWVVTQTGASPVFDTHQNKDIVIIDLPSECGTAASNAFVSAFEHAVLLLMSGF